VIHLAVDGTPALLMRNRMYQSATPTVGDGATAVRPVAVGVVLREKIWVGGDSRPP